MLVQPNIFIVGGTKTGKTSLARRFTGHCLVSGSEWVKKRFEPSNVNFVPGTHEYLEEITAFSIAALTQDPDACINFIRRTYPIEEGGYVIEGLRNPRDFLNLFRPNIDVVIFLHFEKNPVKPTDFEEGVEVIKHSLAWMLNLGMTSRTRIHEFELESLNDLDSVFEVASHIELSPVVVAAQGKVQVSVSPIQAFVEDKVLYNEDPKYEHHKSECTIFGVTSYPGEALTFQILTEQGGIFSYVPFHRVRHALTALNSTATFELQDLVYARCPDEHIVVTRYEALFNPVVKAPDGSVRRDNEPCRVFLKNPNVWLNANYVMTIDWYRQNDLAHIMALENGQFALLPSHKILVGERKLPRYKKMRSIWTVESTRFED